MTSTLVGAPVSKGLIVSLCGCSLLAAITTTQHYFNVPFTGHPHIWRDHQFYRFATRWLIWTNSAEVLLSVLILWYASLEVERIWGSRKFASFLVVVAGVSSIFEALSLVLFARSRFHHTLPAGPFAVIFAIVYQSHRLVPTLYSFELFHPRLLLNNRYPLYVLSLLLLTSQPPTSTILGLCGILASSLYSSSALPLWLRRWKIPVKAYDIMGKSLSPLTGQNRPFRRGNLVTFEEGLLQSLGGVGTEQLLGTVTTGSRGGARNGNAAGMLNVGGNAVRRRSAVQADQPPTPSPRPVPRTVPPPPMASDAASRLPQITGASFLSQWQAGLSGGSTQPSNEQIAELSGIFPHATRQDILQALQENELSTTRAAAALVSR